MDILLSAGERISVALLAMAVSELGVPARAYTGAQAGVLTDSKYGKASIVGVLPERVARSIQTGSVAIVAGFQGISKDDDVTTLGRGGSDTTAVALAAALASLKDAEGVQRAVAEIIAERERIIPALRGLGYDIPDSQSNFYLIRGDVYGLVEACARVGLIVRPFRVGVRVSVGSREQNDRFLSVAVEFARTAGIGA